jgi:hypothetical protein
MYWTHESVSFLPQPPRSLCLYVKCHPTDCSICRAAHRVLQQARYVFVVHIHFMKCSIEYFKWWQRHCALLALAFVSCTHTSSTLVANDKQRQQKTGRIFFTSSPDDIVFVRLCSLCSVTDWCEFECARTIEEYFDVSCRVVSCRIKCIDLYCTRSCHDASGRTDRRPHFCAFSKHSHLI